MARMSSPHAYSPLPTNRPPIPSSPTLHPDDQPLSANPFKQKQQQEIIQSSKVFIKLVGEPPEVKIELPSVNQPTLIKPPTSHPAPIPPTQQDIILAKDDIVDVIDAENEDPFTLESFYTLLQLHIQANKDLILARVTTVDPSNESKLYYSYYAAHHINKVLFRTQPEEGLLHRMKAKNPLNNMTVVGDVHYYVIPCASANNTITSPPLASPDGDQPRPSLDSLRSIAVSAISKFAGQGAAPVRREGLFRRYRSGSNAGSYREKQMPETSLIKSLAKSKLHFDNVLSPRVLRLAMPSSEIESGRSSVLAKGETVDASSMSKLETDMTVGTPSKTRKIPNKSLHVNTTLGKRAIPGSSPGRLAHPSASTRISGTGHRRRSADDAMTNELSPMTSPDATSPAHSTRSRKRKEGLGSPLKDQFNLENLRSQSVVNTPTTKKASGYQHRLRMISYLNDRAPGSGDQAISIHEWVRKHFEAQGDIPDIPVNDARPGTPFQAPEFYEAKFYATDDDFLMQASVRSYFKDTALNADDSVLFTLNSNGAPGGAGGLTDHPALEGFQYEIADGVDSLRGWRNSLHRIRSSRWIKYAFVAYLVGGACIIKYAIPSQYSYLAGFLMVFILAFILIFFVEMQC